MQKVWEEKVRSLAGAVSNIGAANCEFESSSSATNGCIDSAPAFALSFLWYPVYKYICLECGDGGRVRRATATRVAHIGDYKFK